MSTIKNILTEYYKKVQLIKEQGEDLDKIDTEKEFSEFINLTESTENKLSIWLKAEKTAIETLKDVLPNDKILEEKKKIDRQEEEFWNELYSFGESVIVERKQETIENGYIPVKVFDGNGSLKAQKLYKNNEEILTDPDLVAKNLGLKTYSFWADIKAGLFEMLPFNTIIRRFIDYDPDLDVSKLANNEYMDDFYRVYTWNSEKNQFDYKRNLRDEKRMRRRPVILMKTKVDE